MSDFTSVFDAAQQLPEDERLRLIDALWSTVSSEAESAFSDEWTAEIERRVAEIKSGAVATVPWKHIRDEALSRLHDDSPD